MKVESLEERIKLKAHVQLRKEIDEASKGIEIMLRFGHALELNSLFNDKKEKATAVGALREIQDRIFKELISKREDEAIRAFISKVDELQAQIDELRNPE